MISIFDVLFNFSVFSCTLKTSETQVSGLYYASHKFAQVCTIILTHFRRYKFVNFVLSVTLIVFNRNVCLADMVCPRTLLGMSK